VHRDENQAPRTVLQQAVAQEDHGGKEQKLFQTVLYYFPETALAHACHHSDVMIILLMA